MHEEEQNDRKTWLINEVSLFRIGSKNEKMRRKKVIEEYIDQTEMSPLMLP